MVIVTELYHPEETSTGYFLTRIAEGLAERFDVQVLCAQPTYSKRGMKAPSREFHNGVRIRRCFGTRLDKNVLASRVLNLLSITLSLAFHCITKCCPSDAVMVVTNPASLPFLILFACRLRRAKCVLLVHDVYPEVVSRAGLLGPRSWFLRIWGWCSLRLFRGVDRLVVIGRDMEAMLAQKLPKGAEKIVFIPNWADTRTIQPLPWGASPLIDDLGLGGKFVIQYAGNMGRTHDMETILAGARLLAEDPRIHFLLVGDGARRPWVEEEVRRMELNNCTLLPYQDRRDLSHVLNACDVALIAMVPGMSGISVPSRMYNIMASGRPIVALTDEGSELDRMITEENIGWRLPCSRPDLLATTILEAIDQPDLVQAKGARARLLAENRYTFDKALERYFRLFAEIHAGD